MTKEIYTFYCCIKSYILSFFNLITKMRDLESSLHIVSLHIYCLKNVTSEAHYA